MLHLSREEVSLIETLRHDERSIVDVARLLASDPETVRTLIHRTNRTAGREVVRTHIRDGHTICSLAKDVGEYQILSGVRETLGEVAAMHHQTNWKLVLLYFVGTMTFGVVTFFLGYYIATLGGGYEVSLSNQDLKTIFQQACSK